MVFLGEEPVWHVADLDTIADVDAFLDLRDSSWKIPIVAYAYLSLFIDLPQFKSTEGAASPISPAFYLEANKSGSRTREQRKRQNSPREIMFGSRPSSNGSASSSTSSTASSSSSSSSGSSPMAFHDKQHYVCILCNK